MVCGAFTLIEILVVVAIISILAAIAIPNLLEAQTRAKVSRVKNDERVLATALEIYFVDHNRYPIRTKYPDPEGNGFGAPDVLLRSEELSVLTTPIAYITTLPSDVFENRIAAPNNLLDYVPPVMLQHWRADKLAFPNSGDFDYKRSDALVYDFGWGVFSVGPDREFGRFTPNTVGKYPYRSKATTYQLDYDPTNGTLSTGNIYRFQRNGATIANVFERVTSH
ncbi:hypothetical protein BH09SUM1_BH09SUM1_06230 [soil metagenome]